MKRTRALAQIEIHKSGIAGKQKFYVLLKAAGNRRVLYTTEMLSKKQGALNNIRATVEAFDGDVAGLVIMDCTGSEPVELHL